MALEGGAVGVDVEENSPAGSTFVKLFVMKVCLPDYPIPISHLNAYALASTILRTDVVRVHLVTYYKCRVVVFLLFVGGLHSKSITHIIPW